MQNKEIEVKFVITKNQYAQILAELEQNGTFVGKTHQIDTYFVPYYRDFEVDGETKECLRIREQNGKAVLGYKQIHREAIPVYCDEYETEVSDAVQTTNMLEALGFSKYMVVDKTRQSYVMGEFEFDIDTVAGLGHLLEVEFKEVSEMPDEQAFSKIYDYVAKFGITKKDVSYRGILNLLKDKQNNK